MPMNTSVKFFSSTMLNAPKLSATKGSMISVLDACLVDGWNLTTVDSMTVSNNVVTANISAGHGFVKWQVIQVAGATPSGLNGEHRVTEVTTTTVKFEVTGVANGTATGTITLKTAPIGWIKAHAGTNKAAYRIDTTKYPQSPTHLVRFDDNYTYAARIKGYESMDSVDTGTNQFPTDGQMSQGLWLNKTETGTTTEYRSWFIVGDGRLFYFGINNYSSNLNSTGPIWGAFGEYQATAADPYAFVVSGSYASEYSSVYSYNQSVFSSTGRDNYQYIARSYDGLTTSCQYRMQTWPNDYGASGYTGPVSYPNGPNNGLYLCPPDLMELGGSLFQHRGRYPGAFVVPNQIRGRIVPDRQTAVMDDSIAGFEGRILGFYPVVGSSGTREWGVVAFDLTGPWER